MQSPANALEIAFIGGGNMAQAMGRGIATSRKGGQSLFVVDRHPENLQIWATLGASTALRFENTLSQCRIWVLAVKPQGLKSVCEEIKPFLCKNTLVISVAAGISVQSLQQWLGHQAIIRTMPNTPALLGMGVTGMYADPSVSQADSDYAEQLLKTIGLVVRVDKESLIDAVTALSGSGPAYVYLFIESLIAGAVHQGLDAQQAKQMAVDTVMGAAQMVRQTGESPDVLRQKVSSKGGTTLAALDVFFAKGLANIVDEAMLAAARRAGEMSIELGK